MKNQRRYAPNQVMNEWQEHEKKWITFRGITGYFHMESVATFRGMYSLGLCVYLVQSEEMTRFRGNCDAIFSRLEYVVNFLSEEMTRFRGNCHNDDALPFC